jgi:hypothetical protein
MTLTNESQAASPRKKHKHLCKHHHYVAELLAPPLVWIWWTHTTGGVDGLAHTFLEAAAKQFSYNQKIKVVINLFL